MRPPAVSVVKADGYYSVHYWSVGGGCWTTNWFRKRYEADGYARIVRAALREHFRQEAA